MLLPQISCYYEPSKEKAIRVDVEGLVVWFSYRTPIAFYTHEHGKVVRQNEWGPTTGKHLNAIDNGDKSNRVSGERFLELWNERMANNG